MTCPYQDECRNYPKSCFKCFDFKQYKPLKERKTLQPKSKTKKEKKAGMDFEKKGVQKYNQAIRIGKDMAHQQIASGAFHFALGDMITEEELTAALAEFKERGGLDSRGEKQLTIKKEWIEKIKEEAKQMGKAFYFLPIRFKNDPIDYVVLEYDMFLSYIQIIQSLHEQIRLLSKKANS